MISTIQAVSTWMKSTVRPEVPPDNCLYDKRLDCPGALTEHIISKLLNKFPQLQVDNVALRMARHMRNLSAPSDFMTFEDEFLNYALQTKFLLAALTTHVEQLPDLKMLLRSYETSLLANYKIYADPSRQRGRTRDVIRDGVLALKDHPASFLNVIALTPDHLFNMRLTRNGKALDADALNYRYPLVDMLSGQVNNFKVYNEIIAGVELMQGVDITVLNRGAKGLQTSANKAIFS